MPDCNTVITRQGLFDLVWSRPIARIAAEFGVPGTAVTKACQSLNVPRPPSGHWSGLPHVRKVPRPALPAIQAGQRGAFTFGEWLGTRAKLLGAQQLVEVPPEVYAKVHAVARDTRAAYRAGEVHPTHGTLLAKAGASHVRMFLTPACLDRALDILNRLAWVLERNGFTFAEGKEAGKHIRPVYTATGTGLDFGVREALERYERDLTAEEKKQEDIWNRWRFRGTGRLRITVNETYPEGVRKIWGDGKAGELEEKVEEMVEGFIICARGKHAHELEWQEQQRRWDAEARLREAEAQRRQEEAKRGAAFRKAAQGWAEARDLRAFRAACEVRWRQLRPTGVLTEAEEQWLRWADAEIQRTDPLA